MVLSSFVVKPCLQLWIKWSDYLRLPLIIWDYQASKIGFCEDSFFYCSAFAVWLAVALACNAMVLLYNLCNLFLSMPSWDFRQWFPTCLTFVNFTVWNGFLMFLRWLILTCCWHCNTVLNLLNLALSFLYNLWMDSMNYLTWARKLTEVEKAAFWEALVAIMSVTPNITYG